MKKQISLRIAFVLALVLTALSAGIASKFAYDLGASEGLKVGAHNARKKASMNYARQGAAYVFNRKYNTEKLLALPAVKALGDLDEETQQALVEILNQSTSPCYGLSRRGVSLAASLLDEKGPMACKSASAQVQLAHLAWKTFHDVNEAVAVLWVERRSKVPYDEQAVIGDKSRPITVIEFSDYQCPSCRKFHPLMKKIMQERDDVRLVYKHLPLSFHHAAFPAALAAEAAQKQGKRTEMHDKLFALSSKFLKTNFKKGYKLPAEGPVPFEKQAKDIGLNIEQFRKDMRSAEVEKRVRDDMKLARQLGVSSTPSIWVENRRMIEPRNWTFLNRLLDKAKEEKAGKFSWDYAIPKNKKKVPSPKEAALKAEKAALNKATQNKATQN